MPKVYQQADILLFTTIREGFGLAVAEAMACGLPVVATNFINNVPLNKSNQDVLVNFIEYWQVNIATGKTLHFCWVTDFTVTEDNMFKIMRGGRARWKIESVP